MSYVLVHGAGFGADCWDELVPRLDAPVVAVDLPGRGRRSGADLGATTLRDCADAVIADIVEHDLSDVVLVGHSFAGVTVPRVMDAVPGRIRHVVLVAAVVPPDGTRVLDQINPGVRAAVEASLAGGVYRQDPDAARPLLCNDMDEATSASALARLVDDSAALLSEVVDLAGYAREIPRTYVRLLRDRCYVEELQDRSVAVTGARVERIDAGHLAMISAPARLAGVLAALHG